MFLLYILHINDRFESFPSSPFSFTHLEREGTTLSSGGKPSLPFFPFSLLGLIGSGDVILLGTSFPPSSLFPSCGRDGKGKAGSETAGVKLRRQERMCLRRASHPRLSPSFQWCPFLHSHLITPSVLKGWRASLHEGSGWEGIKSMDRKRRQNRRSPAALCLSVHSLHFTPFLLLAIYSSRSLT